MNLSILRPALLIACLPAAPLGVPAQAAAPTTATPTDETVLLPAFTIEEAAETGYAATDVIGAYTYETQVGENRAKGFELRLSANVTKSLQLVGGYTQTHSYISKNPANPTIVGRAQIRSPTHAWTITSSYRFSAGWLKGASVGSNLSYRGQAQAFETKGPYPYLLDPRVVVNARAGYSTRLFGKPVSYNLLVSNLTNEKYYPSSISMGDPASYRFSIEYRH